MRSFTLLAIVALAAAVCVQAQAPIPYRMDGYPLAGPITAPIVMDCFFDLLCPDCAAAWPNIKNVISYYQSNISVTLHTFPLPYHTNGFMAAQAAHVVLDAEPSLATEFADFMFGAQSSYWNGATANMTWNQVLAELSNAVVENNFATAAQFAAGMADDNINNEARVSWKFACSKGVLGTPTFFVNGVNVNGDPSWTLADWRQLLDPLLQPQPTKASVAPAPRRSGCKQQRMFTERVFIRKGQTCPAGEPVCNYLPGKTECCFPGEECIPNVGCRC